MPCNLTQESISWSKGCRLSWNMLKKIKRHNVLTFSTSSNPSVSSRTRYRSGCSGWSLTQIQMPFVLGCTVDPRGNPGKKCVSCLNMGWIKHAWTSIQDDYLQKHQHVNRYNLAVAFFMRSMSDTYFTWCSTIWSHRSIWTCCPVSD